jgi:hypothetical protein
MGVLVRLRVVILLAAWLLAPAPADAADATLFRLFLIDGTAMVSYGEYARVDDRVIFSMPVGGPADQPRLHVVTIPAGLVDWVRTERYAESARYQRYAETRGEEDFQRLSTEVASVLSDIALTTDRKRALAVAEEARRVLAGWPQAHYGYRGNDVREIVSLVDEAISSLRAAEGATTFELSLVATAMPPELEPVLGMPSARQQLDQIYNVISMTSRSSERVALLHSALGVLAEPDSSLGEADIETLRRSTEAQIREELDVDARYSLLSTRLIGQATRAAERARISDVQQVLSQIPAEDAKLGRQRPELVQALRATVEQRLADARKLRLLRDRWTVRQSLYRDYQRSVGSQLLQLVKAQPLLEAIRTLEGPAPATLDRLRTRLSGGAERLQRLRTPDDLRATHDLLIGAWRFAESAAQARYKAIASADINIAWEASSAAAGALMMLSRAQQQLRELLEPPRLQ